MIYENIEIYYTGSLIQLDRGEKNEKKRFLIIDTEKETTESVESEGYKKFIEYTIDNENKSQIIEQARKDQENGHHVNIVKNSLDVITTDFEHEFKIIDKSEKDITNRGVSSTMTEEEKIRKYLGIQNVSSSEIDEYVNEAINIINACRGSE